MFCKKRLHFMSLLISEKSLSYHGKLCEGRGGTVKGGEGMGVDIGRGVL